MAKKRGYSRAFRPHADTGRRYLLDQIPAGLWTDVRAKARRDGVSVRAAILQLLTAWVAEGAPAFANAHTPRDPEAWSRKGPPFPENRIVREGETQRTDTDRPANPEKSGSAGGRRSQSHTERGDTR
jgi:hypothetical protein